MHNQTHQLPKNAKKPLDAIVERSQLRNITTMAAEIKKLLVRHSKILKEAGVRNEMQRLEEWLEVERKGPAPAGVISASGIDWLEGLRNRLKLAADEAQRIESEGGLPAERKHYDEIEDLLKTIRRINHIIQENPDGGANTNITH